MTIEPEALDDTVIVDPDSALALRGITSVTAAAERLAELAAFRDACMVEGEDYGTVPGAAKPFLLKPGAEKLAEFYGLVIAPAVVQRVEEWNAEPPLFHYEVRADLTSKRDGSVAGAGLGSCNSRESRYRWRTAERVCPRCSAAAIISGKEEFGGGWVCWKKRGGCGATFADLDARITSQAVAQIENPDICDLVNTFLKMAKKRAVVDAVLSTLRASNLFSQDEESLEAQGSLNAPAPAASPPPHATPPPETPATASSFVGEPTVPPPANRPAAVTLAPSVTATVAVIPPRSPLPSPTLPYGVTAANGGATTITRVDRREGQSASGSYALYTVFAEDGTRATTFDDALGELAEAYRVNGARVHLVTVRNGSFTNVVEIANADAPDPGDDLAEGF